jgi:hypothetical protein
MDLTQARTLPVALHHAQTDLNHIAMRDIFAVSAGREVGRGRDARRAPWLSDAAASGVCPCR